MSKNYQKSKQNLSDVISLALRRDKAWEPSIENPSFKKNKKLKILITDDELKMRRCQRVVLMQEEEHETDPDSRSDIKADILEFQRKFQLEFKE